MKKKDKKKRKKTKVIGMIGGILAGVAICAVVLVGTPFGRRLLIRLAVGYVDDNIGRDTLVGTDEQGNTVYVDEQGNTLATNKDGEPVTEPSSEADKKEENGTDKVEDDPVDPPESGLRQEDYVTNVLLCGIESVLPGSRADTIMIASLNTKDKTIKLTSILRDTYVDIPGYKKTKINASYGKGGIKMVCDTVETNFKIKLDGYVVVGFDGLEAIVDKIGGVSIELTEQEAEYLNTTNYISKEENRNVKPGVNVLNGNQVVGYCRVRKVPTLGGSNYDFGRTVRQRRVLSAVFNAYKSAGIGELIRLADDVLGYVTTDLTKKQMEDLLVDFIENHITEIKSLRIPAEGAYASHNVEEVGSVLDPDLEKNIGIMYDFIFNTEVR